jgi:hypothetical protein
MTYGRGTFCVGIQFRSQEEGETCMETSDGNEEELLLPCYTTRVLRRASFDLYLLHQGWVA